MKMKISEVDVWVAGIQDRPGALASKLSDLTRAGTNLDFLIARRESSIPGTGVVFVTPLKGAKEVKAAQAAGFQKTASLQSLRVEGLDKPGAGAKLTKALAEAGINLRGFSAAALGKRYVTHLALDTVQDAAKAAAVLRKLS